MGQNALRRTILQMAVSSLQFAICLCCAAAPAGTKKVPAASSWHTAPTLSVMTGFIYEPKKPYTIQQWMENLGNRFDADRWVRDFREVGASHVVFYDKWIDGLVFHDTATTGFKTRRDFVRELAAACQRAGLPLVLYFNAVSDGNPEFDQWSLRDREGQPIVFGAGWPTRYQTLHSPFREKCLAQVRELLGNYGPIHGIWHDIFHERFNTVSPWTARGYEKMFGEPFAQATPSRLAEFNARTLADYLDQAGAIRRERGQTQCLFTANGSGQAFLHGGVWTEKVGTRLQYLFNEGHSFANNEKLARMAWALPKPLDINLLLNQSWFAPLEDAPPPAKYSREQAIAATAIAVCQGAGVNFALTPGHDGRFGADLQCAKAVGAWFRALQPWVAKARPAAEMAILLGPHANPATEALTRTGVFTRWIAAGQPLPACRAIVVPGPSSLDDAGVAWLRDYVQQGGTLIVGGDPGTLAGLCGVQVRGQAAFDKKLRGAAVKVDSQYDEHFSADHMLDGQDATAWASGPTPMPHWAEITLSEPGAVAGVELVSRGGPYEIKDLDVELPEGSAWRTVKTIRDAHERTIRVRLDAPVPTGRVRVKILREWYLGKDRQYADVASIRVLDRAGRNLASGQFVPVRLIDAAAGFEGLALPPSAVAIEPTTATVLARFANAARSPAVLGNRLGQGRVLFTTATLAGGDAALWSALRQAAVGEPDWLVRDAAAARFRFVFAQTADARVLHVIDAAVPAVNYQPAEVAISLSKRVLGTRSKATLLNVDRPLPLAEEAGRLTFTVTPKPVATVVFLNQLP